MIYNIKIPINPIPASRPRVTRYGTFYKEPYNSFKAVFRRLVINDSLKTKSSSYDMSMALKMTIVFYVKTPISMSRKKQMLLEGQYHTKRPDLDNLIKSIKDAMNGVWYKDDSQVVSLVAEKRWSMQPRIETIIEVI